MPSDCFMAGWGIVFYYTVVGSDPFSEIFLKMFA